MTGITLTPEQHAIVQHDHGPAVVFAVAGSGKTTAVVHRIARLVREEVFEPQRILATSFSKACVRDLERALGAWPGCAGVETRTLHAVGYRVLQAAARAGACRPPGSSRGGIGQAGHAILHEVLSKARRTGVPYRGKLDELDHQDFLDYVGACKGNLLYADLEAACLPPHALEVAGQATAPDGFDHYLDLYKRFEEVRQARGALTYDDLLLDAWELLCRHPDLREEVETWYDCIIVDEFQDVNRAQHELVTMLADPTRELMVVGDDDQTIYTWRGAEPSFLLGFQERFDAARYRIQGNFRCPAPQVALAARVIEHNVHREPKTLHLTRGFHGELTVEGHRSEAAMARAIVEQVQAHHQAGHRLSEISVLLRVYAQSAYIEHHLIEAGIPYRIEGSRPFYDRSEVETLLAYVRLALYDAAYLRDGRAPALEGGQDLGDLLCQVANKAEEPRYIAHQRARQAATAVLRENLTISRALQVAGKDAPHYMRDGMRRLAADIDWLRGRVLHRPAKQVLLELDERIGYRTYLQENSGFEETGEGRARNVTALIDYADGSPTLQALLEKLGKLRAAHEAHGRAREAVDLRTIHRAKGLEWPVVLIPHCNEGTLPFSRAFEDPERIDEERRLLYVALTRSKGTTHLHHLEGTRISRFLGQARYQETLEDVATMQELLESSPRSWSPADAIRVVQLTHQLDLERYLTTWWQASAPRKRSMGRVLHTLLDQARREDLLDRLGVEEDELGFWEETFPPPERLPPGGLGVQLDELLPEPAPEPGPGRDPEPEPVQATEPELAPEGPEAEDLFQALRQVRLRRAKELDVPAFVVAHDATLERIVEARPTTPEALGAIKGIGPHFLEEHAPAFLAVLTSGA